MRRVVLALLFLASCRKSAVDVESNVLEEKMRLRHGIAIPSADRGRLRVLLSDAPIDCAMDTTKLRGLDFTVDRGPGNGFFAGNTIGVTADLAKGFGDHDRQEGDLLLDATSTREMLRGEVNVTSKNGHATGRFAVAPCPVAGADAPPMPASSPATPFTIHTDGTEQTVASAHTPVFYDHTRRATGIIEVKLAPSGASLSMMLPRAMTDEELAGKTPQPLHAGATLAGKSDWGEVAVDGWIRFLSLERDKFRAEVVLKGTKLSASGVLEGTFDSR